MFCTWLWCHSNAVAGNITTQPKQGRRAVPMSSLCIIYVYGLDTNPQTWDRESIELPAVYILIQENNCLRLPRMFNFIKCWKNRQHRNEDRNFDHQMSLRKRKFWYSNNGTVHFTKCKQLFEYQHLLLLRDICWSKL